ncbi:MAG: hypothetical protein IJT02_08985 [Synergistaceae bacterium]|nr:hypothetical protein [Synergistaceae bacterium]
MRIIGSLIKYVIYLCIVLIAVTAALFWFDTGSWLVKPLAERAGSYFLAPMTLTVDSVNGSVREGFTLEGLVLSSGDEEMFTLGYASVSPDWDMVLAGGDGLPYIKSLNVRGVSSDLDKVMTVAGLFEKDEEDEDAEDDDEEDEESSAFHLNPFSLSVSDVNFGTPYAALSLDAITLTPEGIFSFAADVTSNDNTLPLKADARINFEPLEVISSDLFIGRKGTGKFAGCLEPLKAYLSLTALSLDEFMRFAPPLPVTASGRLDGRFSAVSEDGRLKANGVVSMPRAEVMDVPLNLRVPFAWDGAGVLTLDNAALNTRAASVKLDSETDINTLRVKANGEALNISLNEIGRIFAPEAGLEGEGGSVKFDVDAVLSGDILGRTSADVKADIPQITAAGVRILRSLAGQLTLTPGGFPRLNANGEIFGGKLFARAEAQTASDSSIKPNAVLSIVNLDIPTAVRTFPALAKSVKRPEGKITARAVLTESLDVTAKLTSDRLGAEGVTLTNLLAEAFYSNSRGIAELEGLSMNLGKGRLTASGSANLSTNRFSFRTDAQNIEPRAIPMLRDVKGTYTLTAQGSGDYTDIKSIKAEADLKARNVGYQTYSVGTVNIPVDVSDGKVSISDAAITLPKGRITLDGTADLLRNTFSLNADAQNVEPRYFVKDVAGTFNLTANASGNYTKIPTIRATADLKGRNLGYQGRRFGNVDVPFTFADSTARINGAVISLPKGRVTLGGTANVNSGAFSFNANAQNVEPGAFVPDLSGTLSLTASGSGNYNNINGIKATADLKARNLGYQGRRFGNVDVPLSFANGTLNIPSARAALPGGTVSLKGTANVKNTANPVLNLSASTQGIDLAELMTRLKLQTADMPVSGKVWGSVNVKGPLDRASVSAVLRAANVKAGELADVKGGVLEVQGDTRKVVVKRLEADINGANIIGNGDLTINQRDIMKSAVNVQAKVGRLNLKKILTQAMGSAPVTGMIRGDVALRGTLGQPALDVQLKSPVIYGSTEIDDITVRLRSPENNHFVVNAGARVGEFRADAETDLRNSGGVWTYQVGTKPLDIDKAIQTQMPDMAGIAKGKLTVNVKGSTKPGADVRVDARIPRLQLVDKIDVTDITLPVTYSPSTNRVELRKAGAKLSDGTIDTGFEYDIAKSSWKGSVKVMHLDFGKLANKFLPEGELVGSVDAQVSMKGQQGMMNTSFASGKFSTTPGYFHKMAFLDKVTPTKRISFENISGSFFWNGTDVFLNPGTRARAGNDEPLYRYVDLNGSLGVPGKGLNLVCDGRFDLKILDQFLGAMKGVFQYVTGGVARNVLKDAAGRVLGLKRRDFQNVSFTLANSWQNLRLLNLKITKPIEDFLPIDILNRDEEKQRDDTQFKMRLRIPTGKGDKSVEEESTTDQFKEQLIDNLFNLGL